MAFKHGVYGEHSIYAGKIPVVANGTIPAYIGTAPIHQNNTENAEAFNYDAYVNKPMLINSFADAKAKLGVSDDFERFTLMEAIYAHFMNGETAIAPIIVVNMAKPTVREDADEETSVVLSGLAGNKVGYINDSAAVIETVTLATLTADDYSLAYVDGKIKVTVTKSAFTDGIVTATYKRVNTSDTVITDTAFSEALNALDICEMVTGRIPTVLASPHYSSIKTYHDLMIAKAIGKIADKWYIDVVVDIEANSTTDTLVKAIAKKATDGYNNAVEKVCFPMVKFSDKIYHLSTMCVVTMQRTDTAADGVPYISPSNKKIYADAIVLKDGTQLFINETSANTANANGLTTVNVVRGSLRLWGGCNGNYNYSNEDNIDPEYRQDVGIRMKHYILNYFQYNFMDSVDMPISRRDIDSIMASVQQWLNSLINEGKMLHATIDFVGDNNSVKDMLSGDFVFDTSYTHTPNAKSLTFKTHYTTEGVEALTNTGGDE